MVFHINRRVVRADTALCGDLLLHAGWPRHRHLLFTRRRKQLQSEAASARVRKRVPARTSAALKAWNACLTCDTTLNDSVSAVSAVAGSTCGALFSFLTLSFLSCSPTAARSAVYFDTTREQDQAAPSLPSLPGLTASLLHRASVWSAGRPAAVSKPDAVSAELVSARGLEQGHDRHRRHREDIGGHPSHAPHRLSGLQQLAMTDSAPVAPEYFSRDPINCCPVFGQ